jgi:hypothetical protein
MYTVETLSYMYISSDKWEEMLIFYMCLEKCEEMLPVNHVVHT